jgi:hypothetical protein
VLLAKALVDCYNIHRYEFASALLGEDLLAELPSISIMMLCLCVVQDIAIIKATKRDRQRERERVEDSAIEQDHMRYSLTHTAGSLGINSVCE